VITTLPRRQTALFTDTGKSVERTWCTIIHQNPSRPKGSDIILDCALWNRTTKCN